MITKFKTALMAGLTAAGITATPASAAVYNFSVSGPATGSGTLTTADTANANGGFLISAITGTFNGSSITGLLAPGSLGGNDNLLFANSTPQLDFNGFSFTAGASNYNIYYNANTGISSYRSLNGSNIVSVTFNAVSATAAVPEPATWAMMIAGFGLFGGAMRRRSPKVAFV